jgi:hypothetical protein
MTSEPGDRQHSRYSSPSRVKTSDHGFHILCTYCFRNRVDYSSDRGFVARLAASKSQIWSEVNIPCLDFPSLDFKMFRIAKFGSVLQLTFIKKKDFVAIPRKLLKVKGAHFPAIRPAPREIFRPATMVVRRAAEGESSLSSSSNAFPSLATYDANTDE